MLRLATPGELSYYALDELAVKSETCVVGQDSDAVAELVFTLPETRLGKRWKASCVLSKTHNWLIQSYTVTGVVTVGGQNASVVYTQQVTEFMEVSPGVFYPGKATRVAKVNGELSSQTQLTVDKAVVNQPVDDASLKISYPRGLTCLGVTQLPSLGGGRAVFLGIFAPLHG